MTDMIIAGGSQPQILKTDVLGRVKTPKDRQEALLDEFEKSGVSGIKFAGLVGINYQTFATWVQRRRRRRKQYPAKSKLKVKAPAPLRWVEAVVEKGGASAKESVLTVHLPGGARMEIADATQAAVAAALLRSLENQPPRAC